MNGLATRNRVRQAAQAQPANDPAEGKTTTGDILVGILGILGAAWLIIEAIHTIWRMYS